MTEAGKAVVARARTVLAEVGSITSYAADQRQGPSGMLRIETTHIQAEFVLPAALSALRERFPHVDVSLTLGVDAWNDVPQSSDADLMMFSTDGRVPGRDLAIPLYRWDPVAIFPLDHPLAVGDTPLTLASLAAFPLVTYDTSQLAPLSVTSTFQQAGLRPRFAYAVRDGTAIKAAVRNRLGVGILAEMAVDTPASDLVYRSLEGLFPRCVCWAVLRRDKVLRDYTVHLLSLLGGLSVRTIERAAAGDLIGRSLDDVPHWTPKAWSVPGRRAKSAVLSLA